MLITSAIITGLGLGAMYGLLALGFHITYVVSNTVNFSQGTHLLFWNGMIDIAMAFANFGGVTSR